MKAKQLHEKNLKNEHRMLLSVVRRLVSGFEYKKYIYFGEKIID